ncbi:hypothetical protein CDAR_600731 [Caerostris darwini]|uniref:Uncharacterized protein n=1 Tax=Caerostris darwini TaxID=1538125 RepID=A0AAV4TW52_9ARAC|nr:hypothetical protein CDAR_600731 [Caerostris darwini]
MIPATCVSWQTGFPFLLPIPFSPGKPRSRPMRIPALGKEAASGSITADRNGKSMVPGSQNPPNDTESARGCGFLLPRLLRGLLLSLPPHAHGHRNRLLGKMADPLELPPRDPAFALYIPENRPVMTVVPPPILSQDTLWRILFPPQLDHKSDLPRSERPLIRFYLIPTPPPAPS